MSRTMERSRLTRNRSHREFLRLVKRKSLAWHTRRQQGWSPAWLGLGTLGIIGWSVATPTVLGAILGVWLDRHWPRSHSWTLALLVGGLCLGCLAAWAWMTRQQKAIGNDRRRCDD
jgi:ATP synthase protein I